MFRVEAEGLDIKKIAESGQVFRLNEIGRAGEDAKEREFELIAKNKILRIREVFYDNEGIRHGMYELSSTKQEYESIWKEYFDMETDYRIYEEMVPREDIFLREASKFSRGMKILKQDKWETLISFIISQRKNIPAIKLCVERLSKMFGKELEKGKYAFPAPEEILRGGYEKLRNCSLGYRTSYVYETAKAVYEGKINLDALDELGDEELLKALAGLKGVGVKVANCVALFAYHRINAFPVDVWIKRIIEEEYQGKFPLERYKCCAGILQQYMFYYARENAAFRK